MVFLLPLSTAMIASGLAIFATAWLSLEYGVSLMTKLALGAVLFGGGASLAMLALN